MSNIPDRESPVPEDPRAGDPAETEALASRPEENQSSQPSRDSGTDTSAHPDDRQRSRPLAKKLLRPIVLAIVGGVLFVLAIALYPSPGEIASPSYVTLELRSTFSIGSVSYYVSQMSSSIAKILVVVELPLGVRQPAANAPATDFFLIPPPGITFQTCPNDFCYWDGNGYYWTETLNFNEDDAGTGFTNATFFVKAHSFGYAFNDVDAAAAIPQVTLDGPGSLSLHTQYDNATSANSYDWSALPTGFANATTASWDEQVTSGVNPGRVAVGINQGNEQKDSNKTFFAGALIGLAGGALLSAVQEFLHMND